jgi:ATP-dependent DNA helicase RecG
MNIVKLESQIEPQCEGGILNSSCRIFKGAGPKILEKLERLSIYTVADLLFHIPLHYQDRTHIRSIRDLRIGDYAVIEGVIDDLRLTKGRKQSLLLAFSDASGVVTLRFFHFRPNQLQALAVGTQLRCFGEVRQGKYGVEMVHPEYRYIYADEFSTVQEALTPIYPSTQGLHQAVLRQLTEQAINHVNEQSVPDWIPESLRAQFHLPHLADALLVIHRPPPHASCEQLEQGLHPSQQRLAFEELLAHQLSLRKLRYESIQRLAPSLNPEISREQALLKHLGFHLTGAQERVLKEISQDLIKTHPMMRLVQGDVGSGKTVVAAVAMLKAADSGLQAAFMAPTDLLAEQHYHTLVRWLEPLGLTVAWLAGKHKGKNRQKILERIANGEDRFIVGTHALFQNDVVFNALGLVIIDEQHRFGVEQRLALRAKGIQNECYPHQLVMTATPIPRTLAMTFYADLDVSVIDELPPGRKPVKTVAISNEKRNDIIERIRHACEQQRQVYWVCTLIEDSEKLESQAAEALAEELKHQLSELRIGLVHGRMKSIEKEVVMQAFKAHELDVLVATTVIEVGVDVANASLMIIENAERLGLSQLHQLRGRVGRGATESFCVLLYQNPLSEIAHKRLEIMRETHDGFEIARQDLSIRGPGEFLGTKQTGATRFRIVQLERDQLLLPQAQKLAEILVKDYPKETAEIIKRWLPQAETLAQV